MAFIFNSKKFTLEIIDNFQALLSFMDTKFGKRYMYGLSFTASVGQSTKETLTLRGTMIFFFINLTKRPYPTGTPTAEDIVYINAIWDALKHPENKLPT
jgi:hypothetical protein